jgi:hypothetical protein
LFENRVLRRTFGPKRDEVIAVRRKLHNEKLNELHRSPNIIQVIKLRGMRWTGHVTSTRERGGVYRIVVGKPEGRRLLGRPRRRRKDNIDMDLQEVGWEAWTESIWFRIGTGGRHF